jgi:hypothetical protein
VIRKLKDGGEIMTEIHRGAITEMVPREIVEHLQSLGEEVEIL